jgi:serine/threonine protein kinase
MIQQAILAAPVSPNEVMMKIFTIMLAAEQPELALADNRLSSAGQNLNNAIPELLALVGTLSPEQQKSFMGILGNVDLGQPTKRPRQQKKQPAGSLDAPCLRKKRGSTTPAKMSVSFSTPAPNVGIDGEAAKDAGTLEPHLRRDTTGTFRTAFVHSPFIRQKTLEWIQANCATVYATPVQTMWLSGSEPWTRGAPVPTSRTLANWVRVEKNRLAATVEIPVLTKEQIREGHALACRVKQERLGASSIRLTRLQIQSKAFQVSMSWILQFVLDCPDSTDLPDSTSKQGVFNILLVSKDMHAAVTKTAVFSKFMADMLINADFQRILREFEFSKRLNGPAQSEVVESSRKIPVLFPKETPARVDALTSVIGKDVLDSLSNLGDGMPFIEQFAFIGKGTYGSVWAAHDTMTQAAWKVMHHPVPLWAIPKAACNEFTMNLISQVATRPGKATRKTLLPFAIGPIDTPGHPMLGKQCFGLPSKEKPGMFYAVLVKRLAQGTLLGELRAVSKLFSKRNGEAPPGALARVACMMECALEAVDSMHSYAGSHRDIKADNFLLEEYRPDSQGRFMRTLSNKKVKVWVGDLGLAIPHGVQTYCGKQKIFSGAGSAARNSKRAARQVEKDAGICLGQDNTVIQQAHDATEAKLREPSVLATALKVQGGKQDAPVLMEVNIRALHLLTGAFPSHGQPDDPPPPPQYASGWGTHLYSPPEKTPKLPPGRDYSDSRSFQAGDMWAMGAMLSEMVKGDGLKVAYQPDDSHGKGLFATCFDGIFWRSHLNKLGDDVPDEWQPCVDLIRNLCASKPEDRMSASDALQHEFLRATGSEARR